MYKTLKQSIAVYAFFWSLFLAQCVTIFYCMMNSPEQMKVLIGYGLTIWFFCLLAGLVIVLKRAWTIDRFHNSLTGGTGLSDHDLVAAAGLSLKLPIFISTVYFIMWNFIHTLTFISFKTAE